MGETIDSKKIRLVKYIAAMQDEDFIDLLGRLIEHTQSSEKSTRNNSLQPIRASQSIADMIREQNYTGFDLEKFNTLIMELDIKDQENQLLQQLTP